MSVTPNPHIAADLPYIDALIKTRDPLCQFGCFSWSQAEAVLKAFRAAGLLADPTTPALTDEQRYTGFMSVDAIDPAVNAFAANPGWQYIGCGSGSGGQLVLTFAWPAAVDRLVATTPPEGPG